MSSPGWRRRAARAGGSVTGIVGAAGGLGGYFPPLVMGATYNAEDKSYAIGLLLLAATALVAFAYTTSFMRGRRTPAEETAGSEAG